jgi:hypothetical protein
MERLYVPTCIRSSFTGLKHTTLPVDETWMNLEELEFAEGKGALECYLASQSFSRDAAIYSSGDKVYWRRNERFLDLTLSITTLAHGGTKYAGRKLFEASLILGTILN